MTNKIIKMLNKYTIDSDTKREVLKGERKVRRRRMLAMSILAFVLTFVFISIGINQKVENRNLQDEVRDTELVLEETNEEHEALKQEIAQLNDDNYIRRIARGDFFMSDSGELIFSLPESKKEKDKEK
ncbi:FtsB family cell division protein [Nosocomiicoccus ampullae]|uniref:Cell division protein DivIC n=1 Tax=Nosocomiicoccus ampullae TaxID=489910 RepID=A0A9Q2D0H3_9STAP|nr:septum formation initiator family protein [Nosocomiicoccus ampullae]MBB5176630.1 cell division protein DivIC [Nosocomiicoccus ampullae]QYA46789.1 septum formation initiator family protein [Nosocomiicoccus ampullae]